MAARKRKKTKGVSLPFLKRKDTDFKPDAKVSTWSKTASMTLQQRQRLLKWGLYTGIIVLALVLQDVLMSRMTLLGGTTDLAVAVILLITVIEGTEVGSLFVLIASVLYYFSGTAPGAYCIGLMTFLGIAAVMFRQLFWHRSKGSILLCTAVALMSYELGLFVVGILSELTLWRYLGAFVMTGLYSSASLLAFYPLIYKIGLIGGNTWKE